MCGPHQSEPVGEKIGFQPSTGQVAHGDTSIVQSFKKPSWPCARGILTPLLILPVLRPNIEDRVRLGLLKLVIVMEVSPDLDSAPRTTHEERLL